MNDKYMEIISTFWVNKASIAFRPTLMALIRSETHSKPRRETFTPKTYEERAAEYYARHGTVGEFQDEQETSLDKERNHIPSGHVA